MTVAAVILAPSPEEALRPIDGRAAIRRLADIAWSGGALPIVVVAGDPSAALASALAGAPVTLAEPAPGGGGIAAILRGAAVAIDDVSGTTGILIWPAEHVWVGAETVTSLIEAHGVAPEVMVIPTWEGGPGWPVLVPASALVALEPLPPSAEAIDALPAIGAAGFGAWPVSLGDPGSVLGAGTPRGDLPPYEGPGAPVSGQVHEWGDDVAADPETAPVAGPARAPWVPPPGGGEPE